MSCGIKQSIPVHPIISSPQIPSSSGSGTDGARARETEKEEINIAQMGCGRVEGSPRHDAGRVGNIGEDGDRECRAENSRDIVCRGLIVVDCGGWREGGLSEVGLSRGDG